MLDAVCTHVTSSAALCDSAVKLTTDSYQFWVAHLNLRVTFQWHIRFARKVQKYCDAFSKSSSIQGVSVLCVSVSYLLDETAYVYTGEAYCILICLPG